MNVGQVSSDPWSLGVHTSMIYFFAIVFVRGTRRFEFFALGIYRVRGSESRQW
jgi:hypothetical protein